MQFLQLYGTELDRELGSSSPALFTTLTRKAAINAGQLEWVKRTECFQKQTAVALANGTQEYDLEATILDFAWIARQGVSIKIVSGASTRYLEGHDLEVTSVERLNMDEPGWRAAPAGTPRKVYIRRDGATVNLGFYPPPAITGADVWTAMVPYVVVPADMVQDTDEPFSVSGNALISMRPWHRGIVHFAAYDLEKLRKDQARSGAQLQLFELEVSKFMAADKPKGGQRVRFAKSYRQPVQQAARRDPRAWP